MMRRLWILATRVFSRLRPWIVTLKIGHGVVEVTPQVRKTILTEGRHLVIYDSDTDKVEIMMLVRAVDIDHALERAMPRLSAVRDSYLQSLREYDVKMGNMGKLVKDN